MAKIEGIKRVQSLLKKKEKDASEANISVIVGYTANYAIFSFTKIYRHGTR